MRTQLHLRPPACGPRRASAGRWRCRSWCAASRSCCSCTAPGAAWSTRGTCWCCSCRRRAARPSRSQPPGWGTALPSTDRRQQPNKHTANTRNDNSGLILYLTNREHTANSTTRVYTKLTRVFAAAWIEISFDYLWQKSQAHNSAHSDTHHAKQTSAFRPSTAATQETHQRHETANGY